ncbi:transcriptional regulator, TetR family [Desulfatibacillum aliphaticivorans]|uniref:Transcriptional regulator, TetR family n=1 Tax=Desulfatibacillum aliphaticivorans TaxID=218208 RepID=B8FE74_DESAL|nr:TetR/AcrR family transcriptional regulator [Desulfatibacillum aliphaticivorans]ACL06855.1 transcriptional regulator, TetR family [Desulfatibacillum aliphaticivorans]
MTAKTNKPMGKAAVMEAILEASTALFAEKGIAAVSWRDIAAKANVNPGLIHRHFRTKENIRLQVQDRLMEEINKDIGEPGDPEEALVNGVLALRKNDAFWKVMARTFLDGKFEGDVQTSFPFLQKMVDSLNTAQDAGTITSRVDPTMLVAGGTAMALGLLLFEKYILPATGLDAAPPEETQDAILNAFLEALLK